MQTVDYEILSEASNEARIAFYKKTYAHVGVAILAFILVESLLIKMIPLDYINLMLASRMTWLAILGGFWLVSILAERFTMSLSRNVQYAGLALYVLIESVIFLPIIYYAVVMSGGNFNLIGQAGLITLFLFGGLSAYALLSKRDFSFMRSILIIGGFVSLGLIVAGAIFGFNLGLWFSYGMVLFAAGSIIYQTSKLKDIYSTEQYVGAALQVFASVMLLFWYILRIVSSRK